MVSIMLTGKVPANSGQIVKEMPIANGVVCETEGRTRRMKRR